MHWKTAFARRHKTAYRQGKNLLLENKVYENKIIDLNKIFLKT